MNSGGGRHKRKESHIQRLHVHDAVDIDLHHPDQLPPRLSGMDDGNKILCVAGSTC
jgi:hypothetical protein